MRKYNHVHKYERIEMAVSKLPKVREAEQKPPYVVYRCTLPNCNHYLHEQLVVGKESQCWGTCGGSLILTNEIVMHKKTVRPKCRACIDERQERLAERQEIEENA